MHTALRLGVRLAERVRSANPAAHVCFYGPYATLNAEYLLDGRANSVIGGEYEQPLLDLADALESGSAAPARGVRTRLHAAEPSRVRVAFQPPDRTALPPLEEYARLELGGTAYLAGYTETSRGCLHTCLHCPLTPVYGGRFFVVPRDIVLGDIRAQVRMGARHITFGDPDFLNGPGHALAILRAMHGEFPHLTFDATIKIEHILKRRTLVPELRDLGCVFIVSAVESLSDGVLRRLDKGHTRADVVEALEITRRAGIALRPSLLPFTPWETLEGYVGLLDFVQRHRMIEQVDPVQYSIRLLVPPGSALMESLRADGLLGTLDAAAYTWRWDHPDPRMDALQREVAEIVEAAERTGEAALRTFERVRGCAHACAGRSAAPVRYAAGAPAPRMSESWFC
jgi:radical SAM superfamily enzyme YgiQ (UPF0313 family)